MIVDHIIRRFSKRVQAKQRFLIYDNPCMARKCGESRFPHKVRHWTFVVDRKHWDNHTACSLGFNMDEYPALNNVNSQFSEQLNRSLWKLFTALPYYHYAFTHPKFKWVRQWMTRIVIDISCHVANYCQYWQELWLGFKNIVVDNNCQILFIIKMVYISCQFWQLLSI